MRIYIGPWFWAAYIGLTALLLVICAGVIYISNAMQQACT